MYYLLKIQISIALSRRQKGVGIGIKKCLETVSLLRCTFNAVAIADVEIMA